MRKGLKIILIIVLLFLAGGGAYFYFHPKKALKIIFPEVNEIRKIHVKFSGDTALIDIDFKLENKSFFKLNIDSIIYNIKLDTSTLLSKAQNLEIDLKPGQVDTMHLPIALPFKRLMTKLKSLQKQDSVGIDLDIRVVYATVFGTTVLPFKRRMNVEVPVPPEIEVEKIEFVSRHKKTVYLNAHVKIINEGKLDINISDIQYTMLVKDLFVAKGKDPKEIHLDPETTVSVILPIKVEFEHLFKTLVKVAVNDDKVNYKLKITALLQADKLDQKKTPIEIEKAGVVELKK